MDKKTKTSEPVCETIREMLRRRTIVHPKLVVTRKSGAAILKQIRTAKPAGALRALLRDAD